MPGISGSTVAPTQARFGVLRFGAFRFGDYYPMPRVYVDSTNWAFAVRLDTLEILDHLNDQPNECLFTMRGNETTPFGFAPRSGHTVIVTTGDTDSRLFAGSIVRVTQRQEHLSQEINYDVEAVDYSWLLDRRFVNKQYEDLSASEIAADIIASFTTGGFTANHVEGGLDAIYLPCEDIRPSAALTQLANLVGAAWYIDAFKDLHFFTTESGVCNPPTLNSSNAGIWGFQAIKDSSQIRTRSIVQGVRTSLLIAVPAGSTSMPIEDGSGLYTAGNSTDYLRIGGEVLPARSVLGRAPVIPAISSEFRTVNDATCVLATDAATGATTLSLTVGPTWSAGLNLTNWAQVGDQIIYFDAYTGGGTGMSGIPASGYGAINADLTAGMSVKILDAIVHFDTGYATEVDHRAGDQVILRYQLDDAIKQAALAALEGGDGIREHVVDDERLSYTQTGARAIAELLTFGEELVSVVYETRHPSTIAGRAVTVNYSAPMSISDAFTIREVRIFGFDDVAPRTSHTPKKFPIREVRAMPFRLGGFVDLMTRGEDSV